MRLGCATSAQSSRKGKLHFTMLLHRQCNAAANGRQQCRQAQLAAPAHAKRSLGASSLAAPSPVQTTQHSVGQGQRQSRLAPARRACQLVCRAAGTQGAVVPDASVSVILLAGGVGKRMGAAIPKQYLPLRGQPIATYSLKMFANMPEVREVRVMRLASLPRTAHTRSAPPYGQQGLSIGR